MINCERQGENQENTWDKKNNYEGRERKGRTGMAYYGCVGNYVGGKHICKKEEVMVSEED